MKLERLWKEYQSTSESFRSEVTFEQFVIGNY